jgi:hypothetical protein
MRLSSLARFAGCLLVSALPIAALGVARAEDPASGPARWEEAIRAMETADQQQPPPRQGVLFVGSSSIRMWDLPRWFPGRSRVC